MNIEEIKNVDYFFKEDYGDRVCSKDVDTYYYLDKDEIREDPDLISIVEELGEKLVLVTSKIRSHIVVEPDLSSALAKA